MNENKISASTIDRMLKTQALHNTSFQEIKIMLDDLFKRVKTLEERLDGLAAKKEA